MPSGDAPAERTQKPTFRPAAWHFTLARTIARYLLDNQRVPAQVRLAEECHVSREAVNKAWNRPAFQTWLSAQLAGEDALMTRLIRLRIAGQALGGAINQQRLWFELLGELRGHREGEGGGAGGWTVNILVPMTPPPDAALPGGLPVLPAAAGV